MPLTLHRRGTIWHIRGTVAGQRVRQSTGPSDKRQADLYRARIEAQALERHTLGRSATLTFAQAALTYLESGGEARFMAPLLTHFGPDFHLHDLDNDAANRAARALYPGAAPATINRQVIKPLSAVLNMAADEGHMPPRRLRRRPEPQGRIRWLTPGEAARLLSAMDARTRQICEFLIGTGCRTGEALALDRADLHLGTRQAMIARTKNNTARMVRFPPRTAHAMAARGLTETGAVFRTPKGKPYVIRDNGGGQIKAAFDKARMQAQLGRDVTPHVLRHTWATWHYAQNKDLLLLKDLGGWKTTDIALGYAKLAPADLADQLLEESWDFRSDAPGVAFQRPDLWSAGI